MFGGLDNPVRLQAILPGKGEKFVKAFQPRGGGKLGVGQGKARHLPVQVRAQDGGFPEFFPHDAGEWDACSLDLGHSAVTRLSRNGIGGANEVGIVIPRFVGKMNEVAFSARGFRRAGEQETDVGA